MRRFRLAIACLPLAACTTPDAVESNVREPGEPASINRVMKASEQQSLIQAMAAAQTQSQRDAARPLEAAGDSGRWVDVPTVARKAASDREIGVLGEDRIEGGLQYRLRTIHDDPGTLTVMGDPAHGVISVQASIGDFQQHVELARELERAFRSRLREWARVPRSPEDLPTTDQTAGR